MRHDLEPPRALKASKSVLDIGPGIRPCPWCGDDFYMAVEPHLPYAELLKKGGIDVLVADFVWVGFHLTNFQTVLMLDVIEHMDKMQGILALELAIRIARKQVVVYTPMGFQEQEGDAWNLGGQHWQKHRSGWTPDDFPGWLIEERGDAFFAIYNT